MWSQQKRRSLDLKPLGAAYMNPFSPFISVKRPSIVKLTLPQYMQCLKFWCIFWNSCLNRAYPHRGDSSQQRWMNKTDSCHQLQKFGIKLLMQLLLKFSLVYFKFNHTYKLKCTYKLIYQRKQSFASKGMQI